MKRIIPQPKGFNIGNGRVRIAVSMSKELFDVICAQAITDNKSFSEEAELLLRTGLTDIQESDKLEPINSLEPIA